MYLTMRTVWALVAGVVLVMLVPRPATIVAWSTVVLTAACLDAIAAPSPRRLRVTRSVARVVRLGESTTATLTVFNDGPRQVRDRKSTV